MPDGFGVPDLISMGSGVLSVLAIWFCQLTQARLDRSASELISDLLALRSEIEGLRRETKRELERLRADALGLSHLHQLRSTDSLH